jgi:hypothetical protein
MLVALDPAGEVSGASIRPAVVSVVCVPVALCFAAFGIAVAWGDANLARFARTSDTAQAIAVYNTMARSALPGPGDDLYCARRLASVPATDPAVRADAARAALEAAQRATVSADNPPNAWYNLAMFAAAQNDAAATEHALRTAVALAPGWYKPHWALANVLAATGREGEGRGEARQALWLDAGKNAEVRQTVEKLTDKAH